ncbi:outer membrane protein assembly factor BamD [Flavicella sp.]|uniref:outer membrane protein assembly factor BamD n=1 Tax=Flavicella sp. TaxID=2957742 RepID=UPI0030198592
MLKLKYLLVLLSVTILTSCSQYHQVLNKGSLSDKYKMATEMYEAKNFNKSLRLFEMITSAYKGKPQMERIQFMIAQSYFNTKDYANAAYYFEKFTNNYPNSSKREEASFNGAKCQFLASPKYSVDQTVTKEALVAFQRYINTYPDSERLQEANEMVNQLQYKLETKAFNIAKQYYDIGYYTSAVVAFDNMISKYFGTVYREEVFFYKFKSAYELSVRSAITKKYKRLVDAEKAYNKLEKNYPESKYLKESQSLLKKVQEEIALILS